MNFNPKYLINKIHFLVNRTFCNNFNQIKWSLLCHKVGKHFRVEPSSKITGGLRIEIGNGVYIGNFCHLKTLTNQNSTTVSTIEIRNNVFINDYVTIDANLKIIIENNVIIGPYTLLIDNNHNYTDCTMPIKDQSHTYKPITIKQDAWIGSHVIILPGVTIGQGAVIATNSVVSSNVPAYCLAAGTPAIIKKEFFSGKNPK